MVYDVTLKTFIPENNYPDPTSGTETAEGDDRGFARYGSSRTTHFMAIYDPHAAASTSLFADGPYKDAAMSADYEVATSLDGNSRLTDAARNDWTAGPPLKIRWAIGDGGSSMYCTTSHDSAAHMQLQCHASESTPLHPWVGVLFDITYDFNIDFWVDWQDPYSGTVDYLVQGGHDGFPNYEIYVGNQAVFLYDHRWDGQNIWSLGPPEEYSGFFIPGSLQ